MKFWRRDGSPKRWECGRIGSCRWLWAQWADLRLSEMARYPKAGVNGGTFHIRAPLIALSKADIIRRGAALGLDYGLTHSCYDPLPHGAPCGQCDSCVLRAKGFQEAGIRDPLSDMNHD